MLDDSDRPITKAEVEGLLSTVAEQAARGAAALTLQNARARNMLHGPDEGAVHSSVSFTPELQLIVEKAADAAAQRAEDRIRRSLKTAGLDLDDNETITKLAALFAFHAGFGRVLWIALGTVVAGGLAWAGSMLSWKK